MVTSETMPVPLRTDAGGLIRVGRTRVTLDTVVGKYNDGVSAEEIVRRFDVLTLADVYAVIAYYLRNKDEVDAYLAEGEAEAARIRREVEARFPSDGLRERLLARRAARQP